MLDSWFVQTQSYLKRGGAVEIAQCFRQIGNDGWTEALDLATSLDSTLSAYTPLIMEHALLGAIESRQTKMLDYIFTSNQCRIRLCHIKEAIASEDALAVLERCAQHRHTHPFSLNELAGAPTLIAAMKTENLELLELLDRNVSILSFRAFGVPELLAAVTLELWEVVEWLVETKKQSLSSLILENAPETLVPWFVKRGASYSAGLLKSLLLSASRDSECEYSLADTLITRYRAQFHQRVRRDHQFYADTCEYPRIWKWGLENGLKFPISPANWMTDTSVCAECRTILEKRGLLGAQK